MIPANAVGAQTNYPPMSTSNPPVTDYAKDKDLSIKRIVPPGYLLSMVEKVLKENPGIEMTPEDMWAKTPSSWRNDTVTAYGDRDDALKAFRSATHSAIRRSSIPGLRNVRRGWFVYMPKSAANGGFLAEEDQSFEFVGFASDGTTLYRNTNGIIGMLRFDPL